MVGISHLYTESGPGKLPGGVREFGYLRALWAGLCPKFWVFEGRFLACRDKLGRIVWIIHSLHPIHEDIMEVSTVIHKVHPTSYKIKNYHFRTSRGNLCPNLCIRVQNQRRLYRLLDDRWVCLDHFLNSFL